MACLPPLATAICLAACIVCMVGLAIPYWLYRPNKSAIETERHDGLWQACVDKCFDLDDIFIISDSLKAVRALEVLGMLLAAVAVLIAFLRLCCCKSTQALLKLAGVLAFLAGILMIVGSVIYATKVKDDYYGSQYDLHAGFLLCIIAGVGAIVAGVLLFIARTD